MRLSWHFLHQKAPDKSQRLFYLIKKRCKKQLDSFDMLMLMTFTEELSNLKRCFSFPRLNFHSNIVVNIRKLYAVREVSGKVSVPELSQACFYVSEFVLLCLVILGNNVFLFLSPCLIGIPYWVFLLHGSPVICTDSKKLLSFLQDIIGNTSYMAHL